jgi:hypothetical protein
VTENDQSFRWRDIGIVIEVNNDWRDLIKQGATYARALFLLELDAVVRSYYRSESEVEVRWGDLIDGTPDDPKGIGRFWIPRLCPDNEDDFWMEARGGWLPFAKSRRRPGLIFGAIDVFSSCTCIRGRANHVAILMKKSPESEVSAPQAEIILWRSLGIEEKLSLSIGRATADDRVAATWLSLT